MTQPAIQAQAPECQADLQKAAELLGGARFLQTPPTERLDPHNLVARGIPRQAVDHLVSSLLVLKRSDALNRALGRTARTAQRHKRAGEAGEAKPLDSDQSGRAWQLAEILAKATTVFGTQEAAEKWMAEPAMGLDQRAPIDLMATAPGAEQVKMFLIRLEYGVYT